jgi:hypothetical protein
LTNIVRLHGLPDEIISNRGAQFMSNFWKRLFQILGTSTKFSMTFHPKIDGQTERVNQVLEQYLRCMIIYQQDDWIKFLPMAKFSYNNTLHTSTSSTPFFANYGFHPCFISSINPFVEERAHHIAMPTSSINPFVEEQVRQMQEMHHALSLELSNAQERHKEKVDRHRMGSLDFHIDDTV